jgi:hypothetical protein
MKTTLKLILAATSTMAMLAAAAAGTADNTRLPRSTESSRAAPLNAHGSVSRDQIVPGRATNRGLPLVQDCVHVAFPQCSDGAY